MISLQPASPAPDDDAHEPVFRTRRYNVVVADDHPVVTQGLSKVLEPFGNIHLVAAATSISQLDAILERSPDTIDVLICDYSFDDDPKPDGLRLIERLRRQYPEIKLVMLTAVDDIATVQQTMKHGVVGFLSKSSSDFSKLPTVIEAVMRGERFVDAATSNLVVRHMFENQQVLSAAASLSELSARELEVVRMFAKGMTVSEIADSLNRSLKTISTQKRKAMRKLGARNNVELINAVKQLT
ncbi:response regulator transcription factor [Trinickia mobilis]|uniref:response regulator transcription factor n=1 Tax=Trinickia mobilis TaxID=2816356 RepID=UPI001A8CD21C|nr:response regulator transcription factor [Trinickia mobilis]